MEMKVAILPALVGIWSFMVRDVFAGECCKTYYDVAGDYHREFWCPVYCCGTYLVTLTCCDTALNRASAKMKVDFCLAWFYHSDNYWAIILIGVGILILLILTTIGCYCLCTRLCCKQTSQVETLTPKVTKTEVKDIEKVKLRDDQAVEVVLDRPIEASKKKPSTDLKDPKEVEKKDEPEISHPNQPERF